MVNMSTFNALRKLGLDEKKINSLTAQYDTKSEMEKASNEDLEACGLTEEDIDALKGRAEVGAKAATKTSEAKSKAAPAHKQSPSTCKSLRNLGLDENQINKLTAKWATKTEKEKAPIEDLKACGLSEDEAGAVKGRAPK
ncbi:MAG: hypothetical protein WCK39_06060, partial [Methanomassiliicoccales archaeon]